MSIKEILQQDPKNQEIEIKGWVRTFRSNRFISLSDGSTINNLQAVVDFENTSEEILKKIQAGSSLSIKGKLVASQGQGQSVELNVTEIKILGESNSDNYPLQPKKHSLEFLREIAHLRPRTNTFGAILRIRHAISFAINKYFNDNGFYLIHTPIITGSDAEGAGEMFRVTSFDLNNVPIDENGAIDVKEDFFGKETNLTVSGQLEAELAAMGLSKVYAFGPTFRAENSNTSRHLAEFWMIEPEVAFADLKDNMDLAEDFLKFIIKHLLDNNTEDLAFLEQRLIQEDKSKPQIERNEMTLTDKLRFVVDNNFKRVSYTEAIDILRNSKPNKKKKSKI